MDIDDDSESHCGHPKVHKCMWSNLQQLVQCASGSQMWSLVHKWSSPKSPVSSISLDDHTTDHSPLQSFSWLLIVPEVLHGMEHLQLNGVNASPGIDAISQKDVLTIPAEELVHLFNYCLRNNEIPQAWLLSLLAAVPKKGRDLMTLEDYHIIGLQSCLMKLLMLIIEFWVTEWIDNASILPFSQNNFQHGNHTHNNSFILHTAIDHAYAHG